MRISRKIPTPLTDKACDKRYEPTSGLVWADDMRKVERALIREKKKSNELAVLLYQERRRGSRRYV